MMSQDIETEALTLTSIPFKDYDRILTLFTKEQGLIKLIIKGANRPKNNRLIFAQPLTYASYILRKKRGDFHLFVEGKLLDPFLNLRESYEGLKASFDLTQALTKTYVESHPSQDLFHLLKSYLYQLGQSENPWTFAASFYLKVLLYEGCLALKRHCSRCGSLAPTLFFQFKDYFCDSCTMSHRLPFSQEELQLLFVLVKERSFEQLKGHSISQELYEKIRSLFGQLHEVEL